MSGAMEGHWTGDEELLEAYVLGRVPSEQRRELDGHLRACERCRAVVAHERMLTAGVKLAGRTALKERLAHRLTAPQRRVGWLEIASAAAIVTIAIGIAAYNRWLPGLSMRNEQAVNEQQDTSASVIQSAKRPEFSLRDAPLERKGSPRKTRQAEQPAPAAAEEDRMTALDAGAASRDKDEKSGAVSGLGEIRNDAFVNSEAVAPMPRQVWLEGIDIAYVPAPAALKMETSSKAERPTSRMAGEQTVRERDAKAAVRISQMQVQVQQRMTSELSAMQQQVRRTESGQRSVQTLLERTGDELRMTLYLDPPASAAEIASARVMQVSPDSMIVLVGRQQIGYRLPAGWTK